MVTFATQNVIMHPPFTKLDILICRNLLIYLTPELQKKLMPLFHFSLNPDGILFLGSAESIGTSTDLFSPLLHELQVHQIELELQNAELTQARDEMESALEKYTDLYDFAPVTYFTLDHVGNIRAANLTAATLFRIERSLLLGARFSLFVVNEHRQLFSEFLEKVFVSLSKESCEVMLTTKGESPLYAQIEAIMLGAGQECRVAVTRIL